MGHTPVSKIQCTDTNQITFCQCLCAEPDWREFWKFAYSVSHFAKFGSAVTLIFSNKGFCWWCKHSSLIFILCGMWCFRQPWNFRLFEPRFRISCEKPCRWSCSKKWEVQQPAEPIGNQINQWPFVISRRSYIACSTLLEADSCHHRGLVESVLVKSPVFFQSQRSHISIGYHWVCCTEYREQYPLCW